MPRLRTLLTIAAIAAAVATASLSTQAQTYYTINGQGVTDAQAQYLAGLGIPPGAYWMDAQGNVEPAEPGYIRPTPGGTIISDGQCTFVASVPVGNC